uniref:Uncharacterized protein n=1 Tax=Xiphophorus couchianus TaxID=32473 RepID=A0A3B5MUN3_9TELE
MGGNDKILLILIQKNLKKDLDETEKKIGKLMDLQREDLVHTTKSIEATRTHLQGQLRNKEAENNRLTVHLRVKTLHPVNLKL